jgi:hypothetical protein
MRLTELIQAFSQAEDATPSQRELFSKLQRVALDVVYAENNRGGEARQVVADVARILGTDIDVGPGHRWDADHMQRVVTSAQAMKAERNIAIRERDDAKEASEAWKELAERNDETSGPLRANLRRAERERDAAQREGRAWRDEVRRLRDLVEEEPDDSGDVDELKATIVSQAREIARLKGESA